MLSRKTDEQLIRAYMHGCNSSFEQLLERHRNKIFSYILLTVRKRDVAEDIFQDVFLKVIQTMSKGSYTEDGKFLPWVMRIAHNMIMDYFRLGKRMQFVDNPEEEEQEELDVFKILVADEQNAEEKIICEEMNEEVRALVERLPEEQKEILVMRHYGKMSFREISELTNVNISTCLGRMRYALIGLRKMMEQQQLRKAA